MAKGQYTRIYHALKDEYPDVWKSDAQLALFVRLLIVADKWWPQWAPIGTRNGAYQSLVKCGLVLENEGTTGYSILGLHKERSTRSEHARHAVSRRWEYSENTQAIPSKAEKNKEEQGSNGTVPSTFLRWEPKEDRAPGEAVSVYHGPGATHPGHETCLACHPLLKEARP